MTAGLLHTGKIWRFSYLQDDSQGGAVPSGTVIYNPVFARIFTEKPTLALLEQGLETPAMYSAIIEPGDIAIQNNDQYEETGPNISPYLGWRFVIVSDPQPSMLDSRRYWKVVMRRFQIAHTNNLQ
jgi:hypothetical protein